MKLCAFRIKNFRSIVDTEWQNLSPDNITCLIGQNESGKTSVLEALRAFYTGVISEDVLRSDLSMPEITCRFSVKKGWLVEITGNAGTELKELLSGLSSLDLTRTWMPDFTSVIKASGAISDYLDSLENAWKLYLEEVQEKLKAELETISNLENTIKEIVSVKTDLSKRIGSGSPGGIITRLFHKEQPKGEEISISELKKQYSELVRDEQRIRAELLKKEKVKKAGAKYLYFKNSLEELERKMNELSSKLEEYHQKLTLLLMPVEKSSDPEWAKVLEDYRNTRKEKEKLISQLEEHIAFCGYLMEGKTEEEALLLVEKTIQRYRSQYTSEMLGKKYFEYCPVIELFEDFGSLLPNRIDLEDIIKGNDQVEGYKAARNFLTLAQLDYSFFQQTSSRILKQKIENLNNTLTVNFQDFWQQSIGKNNKIKIQFELDHYSLNYGDKAGKPYLEFWVKDAGERLYPKQRSRGVRWFLSFYMELKAAALRSTKPMILLIDEPGLSLHARAQEDVLKVFEDIKEKIQIIYTTHSPHLVDINKLHRVLAVQRDDMDNMKSATRIFDAEKLAMASPDTLTPLQTIMGNRLASEGFAYDRINLIVNDIGTFYMLSSVLLITNFKGKINIIPSTDISTIPLMCNIMLGWGLKFAVLLFGNEKEKKMEEYLKESIFRTSEKENGMVIVTDPEFLNAEDLLSTLDFKNHVLKTREGITVPNSVYMAEKGLPRNFLLSRLLSEIKTGKLTADDFDEETHENFKYLTGLLKQFVK
ncbi:MAG TPA: AAA family ATPase [Bacteroidales bacterium]|nr:AAA family ATPase [Bacteroidales bacterium]